MESWSLILRSCFQSPKNRLIVNMCKYPYKFTYAHTYLHIYTYYTFIYSCTYTHNYIYAYIHIYTFIIHIYIYAYIDTYLHTHTYIHTYNSFGFSFNLLQEQKPSRNLFSRVLRNMQCLSEKEEHRTAKCFELSAQFLLLSPSSSPSLRTYSSSLVHTEHVVNKEVSTW